MLSYQLLPYRRLKSLLWFFLVVVLLQLFLFVADQLKSKDSVLFRDCSALESSGTVNRLLFWFCFCLFFVLFEVDVKVVRAVRVDRIIELIYPPETPFEKDFCDCFDGYKISGGGIARPLYGGENIFAYSFSIVNSGQQFTRNLRQP